MADPDRNRQREHWQAIAEQLGLAPEEEVSAENAASKATPAAHTTRTPPGSPAEPAAEIAAAQEPTPDHLEPDGETRGEETQVRERAEPSIGETQTAKPGTSEVAEADADARTRKGRRGRRTRDTRALASRGDEPPEASLSEEAGDRPMRRDRGRDRHKKTGARRTHATRVGEAETKPQEAEPAEEDDSDPEDLRSLSTWNVPSWNELIASLYRPER